RNVSSRHMLDIRLAHPERSGTATSTNHNAPRTSGRGNAGMEISLECGWGAAGTRARATLGWRRLAGQPQAREEAPRLLGALEVVTLRAAPARRGVREILREARLRVPAASNAHQLDSRASGARRIQDARRARGIAATRAMREDRLRGRAGDGVDRAPERDDALD